MFFWNALAFSMIQQMLAIWSLVPLPFLKPAWTSRSSQFKYCWSLAWRILSICKESDTTEWLNWWESRKMKLFAGEEDFFFKESLLFMLTYNGIIIQFSYAVVSDFLTIWTAAHQASLSITNSWSLLKLMSIDSVMPSNHLILCRPLLLLPSIFPSIRVFSNGSALHIRWPKCWSFSFHISLSNECSGLISFRIGWFDHLAVPGTLKSLLQHCNLKASVLWCSTFSVIQLSHPYMTTGKTIALTIQTFVCKVMSLVVNTSVTLGKRLFSSMLPALDQR